MSTFALHTDLYQLTMLASYFHQGRHRERAVCEMFVRRLPKNRRFLVTAGLARALSYLEGLRFTDAQIETLKTIPGFKNAMSQPFIEYLRGFRFTGNVCAMPEGTVAFHDEHPARRRLRSPAAVQRVRHARPRFQHRSSPSSAPSLLCGSASARRA